MADLPRRSDRSDLGRYDELRQIGKDQQSEASATRPENVRSAVAGWSTDQTLPAQERSALYAIRQANQHRQGLQSEGKQPERAPAEQERDKQAYIREMAEKFAPKQQPQQDRPREREQERE